ELALVVDTKRLLRLIEGISEVEATIKWTSNKKLHLEIVLIRAIQTLSEVSMENVIDALENPRGASGPDPVKGPKIVPVGEAKTIKEPNREIIVPIQIATTVAATDKGEKAEPKETANQRSESRTESSALDEPAWSRILETIRARRPLIVSWL